MQPLPYTMTMIIHLLATLLQLENYAPEPGAATGVFSWSVLLNYLLSGTSLVSLYVAWNSRKSVIKQTEANAMATMQQVYDDFARQARERHQEMKQEIADLRQELEQYKQHCANCQIKGKK